jgi:hypothetical protein
MSDDKKIVIVKPKKGSGGILSKYLERLENTTVIIDDVEDMNSISKEMKKIKANKDIHDLFTKGRHFHPFIIDPIHHNQSMSFAPKITRKKKDNVRATK